MKTVKLLSLLVISLIFLQACGTKQAPEPVKLTATKKSVPAYTRDEYNNTKGYWDYGDIITRWDCPDSRFFLPIDIKSWDKTPAVNGRLPTYDETMNGTAISHYGEKDNPDVKPYTMTLPRLAYHYNSSIRRDEIVVVVQIVQTATDTIVGYRYLTGGCGGSIFRDFRFLTDKEVEEAVE